MGEAPLRFVGGVFGLLLIAVGELGEAGRRKGEVRGELNDEDLYEAFVDKETYLSVSSTDHTWAGT